MLQIIEGIGNEVTLIFFLLSAAAAVALPWYFLGPPSASQEQVDSARPSNGSRPTVPVEETSAQQSLTNEFDARNCGDVSQFPTDLEDRTGQEVQTNTTADSAGNNYRYNAVDRREDQHTFTTNTNTNHGTSTPREADIALKIKLHEQDQNVTVSKTMTLANLKRLCFENELRQGHNVRLVYNGRILQGDNNSLEFLGLKNGCVIHAQVSEYQADSIVSDDSGLEIGNLFAPFIGVVIVSAWLLVFVYDELFNTSSIIILSFLSGIFIFFTN